MKVIVAPIGKDKPRSFFDKLNDWAKKKVLLVRLYDFFSRRRWINWKGSYC